MLRPIETAVIHVAAAVYAAAASFASSAVTLTPSLWALLRPMSGASLDVILDAL